VKVVSRKSRFITHEAKWYKRIGEEFTSHDAVNDPQKAGRFLRWRTRIKQKC
jgi:hypothetical protein